METIMLRRTRRDTKCFKIAFTETVMLDKTQYFTQMNYADKLKKYEWISVVTKYMYAFGKTKFVKFQKSNNNLRLLKLITYNVNVLLKGENFKGYSQ